jgi:hypothetical protein
MEEMDTPLPADTRFSVELARFLDGRPDPSRNVPPGGSEVDPIAVLEAEEQLGRIVG